MPNTETFPMPDVLIAADADVGEGPVIDQRTGRLCWVDILEGRLHENDLDAGTHHVATLGTILGAAVPRRDEDGFAVAVADGLGLWSDGRLTLADPVLPQPDRRMNDAKCDSHGRLWAGSTQMEFTPGGGALHRWDGREPSVTVTNGLTLPNGLGWNEQDTTMYLIDSIAGAVLSAPYDTDDGLRDAFAPFCRVDGGLPDGLAVDVDGSIWVAVWGGSEVCRYDRAGHLTGVVPLPVTQPSSCAFSADGTLYITTARHGLTAQQLDDQPHAGSIFALATATHGVPSHAFAA
jgi:sugar lactone lactonase YvrE